MRSVLSSDSGDEVQDISKSNSRQKPIKKGAIVSKGSKKVKTDRNQMTIEAAFLKGNDTKRKSNDSCNAVIPKVPKLNQDVTITDSFPHTKVVILPEKHGAGSSNSFSVMKFIKKTNDNEISRPLKPDNIKMKPPVVESSSNKTVTKVTTEKSSSIIPTPMQAKSKAAFIKFMHRSGPSAIGSKEIPQGSSNCFSGMTFVITGVLNTIERDDAQALIERHGGKVTKAVSGRTTYLVVGKEPGNSKLQKANTLKTKQINEDQLFDLIRNSSSKLASGSYPLSPKKIEKVSKTVSKVSKDRTLETNSTSSTKPCSRDPAFSSPIKKIERMSKNVTKDNNERTFKSKVSMKSQEVQSSMLLVDKYAPSSLSQIVGQQGKSSPANKLVIWFNNFDRNLQTDSKSDEEGARFRAVLLSGGPGIGKTTTARVVCKQLDYDIVELNASSVRSKNGIKGALSESLSAVSFYQKKGLKYCVIMDEVDGMAGNEDRGGINELIQTIKTTKHPIICICNDRQSRKLQSLVKYVYDLRFRQLTLDQMKVTIVPIIRAESIAIPDDVIDYIIKSSNFDMRQVLNNLQMWSVGNRDNETLKVDAKSAIKEFKLGPFEVIQKVFSHDSVKTFSEKSDLFFSDYQLGGLFVQENYPLVRPYLAKGDIGKTMKLMSLAADSIAAGDIVSAKIRSSNNWNLLPIQAMFSSVIPGEYLHGRFTSRIEFPSWLGKCSKANKNHHILSSLCSHMCVSSRGSMCYPSLISMDYGDLLVKRLVSPYKEGDIATVLSVLSKSDLLKEDMDLLFEATTWSHLGNPLSSVSSHNKSALTRAYNKMNLQLPYRNVSIKKSLKGLEPVLDVQEGDEENIKEEEDEEENGEDSFKTDAMIMTKASARNNKEKKTISKRKCDKEKEKIRTNKIKKSK